MSDAVFEPVVAIKFDGQTFDTWSTFELSESVDDMCSKVRLGVVLPGTGSGLGLTINSVVTVWADTELLATVRVDVRSRTVTATSHEISIEGRSLARELVDCQYSATYSAIKLADIAKRLCTLFKVPLKVEGATELVPEFSMQCEAPANALINAARSGNKLLYPSADGGVVMADPAASPAVATLTYGVDIESYTLTDEDQKRFSEYKVKSYDYSARASKKGLVKDDEIGHFRPMHLMGDRMSQSDGGCERRAKLECRRRKARAQRLEMTVRGWHHLKADGSLEVWRINTQVRVVIPGEDLDAVLLVSDRTLAFDAHAGRTTRLVLMYRAAFMGEPVTKKKRAAGKPDAAKGGKK